MRRAAELSLEAGIPNKLEINPVRMKTVKRFFAELVVRIWNGKNMAEYVKRLCKAPFQRGLSCPLACWDSTHIPSKNLGISQ